MSRICLIVITLVFLSYSIDRADRMGLGFGFNFNAINLSPTFSFIDSFVFFYDVSGIPYLFKQKYASMGTGIESITKDISRKSISLGMPFMPFNHFLGYSHSSVTSISY